jgi:hypothetical protein
MERMLSREELAAALGQRLDRAVRLRRDGWTLCDDDARGGALASPRAALA